jgi:hypothetical protein
VRDEARLHLRGVQPARVLGRVVDLEATPQRPIVDCFGEQSRETDLIIYDPLSLPGIMFSEREGLIPVESVAVAIEVKTKLTKGLFESSADNRDVLDGLLVADTQVSDGDGRRDWRGNPRRQEAARARGPRRAARVAM